MPRGTFVRLNPLIVHGNLSPVEPAGYSLCLLSGRTFANDTEFLRLSAEEQFELTLA